MKWSKASYPAPIGLEYHVKRDCREYGPKKIKGGKKHRQRIPRLRKQRGLGKGKIRGELFFLSVKNRSDKTDRIASKSKLSRIVETSGPNNGT